MGLKESMEELKKQIGEAEKAEEVVEEEPKEEVSEETVAEKPKEEPEKEVKDEPVKEEPKPEEPVKTPADYARERREAKANKLAEELAVAHATIAALQAQREPPKSDEPNKSEDPQGWTEWKIKKQEEELKEIKSETVAIKREKQAESLRQQAELEVQGYEADVRREFKDYDEVKQYYGNMLALSIKNLNPKITNDRLVRAVNDRLLLEASEYLNEGHDNPIKVMYERANPLDIKPKNTKKNRRK
jgi:hypothetical protein